MSLTEELHEMKTLFGNRNSEENRSIMGRAAQELATSNILAGCPVAGDILPDTELINALGAKVKLSEIWKNGPVVLSFYRGGWCPYCNLELRHLQNSLVDFSKLGASLVAVSPELPDESLSLSEKHELKFPVLSDVNNAYARSLGLVFSLNDELAELYKAKGYDLAARQGNDAWELPLPATFVISPGGRIEAAWIDTDYTKRADPSDILAELKKLA